MNSPLDIIFDLFVLFFALNVSYDGVFFLPLLFRKNKPEELDRTIPVSVVISSWDEYDNLQQLLPALFNQRHEVFEVVLINDRSTDESFDFLREYSYKEPRLKVVNIHETPYGMSAKKYALTLGFKAAKNEVLLLTDADCLPNSEDWISVMANAYKKENHQIVLSYSGYRSEKGFLNQFIQYETLYTAFQYLGFANARLPYMGVGRNLSYKKSLFFEKGGFKSIMSFIAGDDDLFVQMVANSKNTTLVLHPSAFTTSKPKTTWISYFQQKKRHLSVGRHYKLRFRLLLGLLFLSLLLTWVLGTYLLIVQFQIISVASMLGARLLLRMIMFNRAKAVFTSPFRWYLTPIIEPLYIFYYLVAGFITLRSKKVTWK